MQAHEKRVVEEAEELADRMEKLEAFMAHDLFQTLPEFDRYLLLRQKNAMHSYLNILKNRIMIFKSAAIKAAKEQAND